MGYRDVLNTIHESYGYIPIHSSYILQLHRDLYKYSERGIGGRFKSTHNFMAATYPDGTRKVLFTPLVPAIGKASVENSLKQLVKDGVIKRHRKGKSTLYTRNETD